MGLLGSLFALSVGVFSGLAVAFLLHRRTLARFDNLAKIRMIDVKKWVEENKDSLDDDEQARILRLTEEILEDFIASPPDTINTVSYLYTSLRAFTVSKANPFTNHTDSLGYLKFST